MPISLPLDPLLYPEWCIEFEENLTACLKLLLETKHLYQSTTIEIENLDTHVTSKWPGFLAGLKTDWNIRDNAASAAGGQRYDITLKVPDVKLFCHTCNRVEAFNSISSQEFTRRGGFEPQPEAEIDAIQVFVLSFLCQSCKGVPEIFLVRRQGLKLTLCGRAPMEVAEVPTVIPKIVRQYYSGALVAHQSGQTLAGLFLLRTLIEQWTRSQVTEPHPPRADELMDKYMALLPDDFKRRFPSMRVLYDSLSADMHGAVGSAPLFESARADIVKHFDARRLFEL